MENRRACAVPLAASYWNCDMMEGSGQPRSSTSWTVHCAVQNTVAMSTCTVVFWSEKLKHRLTFIPTVPSCCEMWALSEYSRPYTTCGVFSFIRENCWSGRWCSGPAGRPGPPSAAAASPGWFCSQGSGILTAQNTTAQHRTVQVTTGPAAGYHVELVVRQLEGAVDPHRHRHAPLARLLAGEDPAELVAGPVRHQVDPQLDRPLHPRSVRGAGRPAEVAGVNHALELSRSLHLQQFNTLPVR